MTDARKPANPPKIIYMRWFRGGSAVYTTDRDDIIEPYCTYRLVTPPAKPARRKKAGERR